MDISPLGTANSAHSMQIPSHQGHLLFPCCQQAASLSSQPRDHTPSCAFLPVLISSLNVPFLSPPAKQQILCFLRLGSALSLFFWSFCWQSHSSHHLSSPTFWDIQLISHWVHMLHCVFSGLTVWSSISFSSVSSSGTGAMFLLLLQPPLYPAQSHAFQRHLFKRLTTEWINVKKK